MILDRDVCALAETLRMGLEATGVSTGEGLTEGELGAIESTWGFSFPPDLRVLLLEFVPLGGRFPDWRGGEDAIADLLRFPLEGVLGDVSRGDYWHPSWGERPANDDDATTKARFAMDEVPTLIPISGHRYLASEPKFEGNPVLSAVQTDIVVYASDLEDFSTGTFTSAHPVMCQGSPRLPSLCPSGPT